MPRKEQSKLESFAIGERVRVVITGSRRPPRARVIVSRAAPELVSICSRPRFPRSMTIPW